MQELYVIQAAGTNNIYKALALIVLVCALFGCANVLEKADQAFIQKDWDTAISSYTRALRSQKDPNEIKRIQGNLQLAKNRGASWHYQSAKNELEVGRIESAYRHSNLAYEYRPDAETKFLLNSLQKKEAHRLIEEGKLSIQSKHWDQATNYFSKAKKIDSSSSVGHYLLQVNELRDRDFTDKFESYYSAANAAIYQRDWVSAHDNLLEAHNYKSTIESEKKYAFVVLMNEADESLSYSHSIEHIDTAEDKLLAARKYGIDVEYIDQKIEDIKIRSYEITFHGAVILPFNPANRAKWDGFSKDTRNSVSMLTDFYGLASAGMLDFSDMSKRVLRVANDGSAAPDPYFQFSFGDGEYSGGLDYLIRDEYRPQWDYSFSWLNVNRNDKRVLSLTLYDADDFGEDDVIGTYQFLLGEMIATQGIKEIVLVGRGNKLLAGGIAGLKFSVVER